MEESEKMRKFNHPNVLNLIGVCSEVGDTPYIVMPYMAKGSGGGGGGFTKWKQHHVYILYLFIMVQPTRLCIYLIPVYHGATHPFVYNYT